MFDSSIAHSAVAAIKRLQVVLFSGLSVGLLSACGSVAVPASAAKVAAAAPVATQAATQAATEAAPEAAIGANSCGKQGVWLQVLGSGGPELTDQRASSGYLVWVDGRARVLVDAGSGVAVNFERAGAQFSDLDMILLSHLHVDHSADLPALIKGSWFVGRSTPLPLAGPTGTGLMPATDEFARRLLTTGQGAFGYLGDLLQGDVRQSSGYRIQPQVYQQPLRSNSTARTVNARAVSVVHGPIPALSWRIDVGDHAIVFSGDMASGGDEFIELLKAADLFVAHNAIPEGATGVAALLHMPPSVIGEYAAKGNVGQVVLSHRMRRSLGQEGQTETVIKRRYSGPISFADDLSCYAVGD